MARKAFQKHKASDARKPTLTHFLCVPLVTPASRPQLESAFRSFQTTLDQSRQQKAEQDAPDGKLPERKNNLTLPYVHPKAIRPVGTLHCTLGVMSLSGTKLQDAKTLLESMDVSVLLAESRPRPENQSAFDREPESGPADTASEPSGPFPPPVSVTLKGLISMHAPSSTSILYAAPADASGRLLPFCQAIQSVFNDKELLVPDDRPLKLHATIVNTIYAKGREKRRAPERSSRPLGQPNKPLVTIVDSDDETSADHRSKPGEAEGTVDDDHNGSAAQGHGPFANAPLKIDARDLLEEFKDFLWAENVVLDRVSICEMGAKKITEADGTVIGEEYTEVARIALPH